MYDILAAGYGRRSVDNSGEKKKRRAWAGRFMTKARLTYTQIFFFGCKIENNSLVFIYFYVFSAWWD